MTKYGTILALTSKPHITHTHTHTSPKHTDYLVVVNNNANKARDISTTRKRIKHYYVNKAACRGKLLIE